MAEPFPIPRSSWTNTIRRWRTETSRRLRRYLLLALGACAAVALPGLVRPAPRLVWNASPSMPIGLYAVSPGTTPHRGDFVVAWLPKAVRALAAARRYLPVTVPLVKRVGAVARDRVCASGEAILINGVKVARRLRQDARGRPLPSWTGCRILRREEIFLISADRPDSFDSRYFGPILRNQLVGTARPIWTR